MEQIIMYLIIVIPIFLFIRLGLKAYQAKGYNDGQYDARLTRDKEELDKKRFEKHYKNTPKDDWH